MNAQVVNNQIVASGLFSRRVIWTDRKGVIVTPSSKGPATVLASVSWEAYVVDAESNEPIADIPKKSSTDTFGVSPGQRPNDEIRSRYLAEVRGDISEQAYQHLTEKIANEEWHVANTVHSTRALS